MIERLPQFTEPDLTPEEKIRLVRLFHALSFVGKVLIPGVQEGLITDAQELLAAYRLYKQGNPGFWNNFDMRMVDDAVFNISEKTLSDLTDFYLQALKRASADLDKLGLKTEDAEPDEELQGEGLLHLLNKIKLLREKIRPMLEEALNLTYPDDDRLF